jgi:diguanylate cyclase (GGDEF)-like protein
VRYQLRFAVIGVVLSIGSPLGLMVVTIVSRPLRTAAAVQQEFGANRLAYVYLALTTALAFGIFGYVLGSRTDEWHRLSTIDALTGLENRRALRACTDAAFSRAVRPGAPLSVLLIDVDQLKSVNDRDGHAAGDDVLQRAACAIKMTVRKSDIGGRWGGDEFLLLAPGTTATDALALGERLRVNLRRESGSRPVTVSVGVATSGPERRHSGVESLVAAADDALLQAKTDGRDRVRVARV